jgi:hypothetical protein
MVINNDTGQNRRAEAAELQRDLVDELARLLVAMGRAAFRARRCMAAAQSAHAAALLLDEHGCPEDSPGRAAVELFMSDVRPAAA